MKKSVQQIFIWGCISCFYMACSSPTETNKTIAVKTTNFLAEHDNIQVDTVDCKLSDGTKTKCIKITAKGIAPDHDMGPWCPEEITDPSSKGGIWFKDGEMYSVDGEFIHNLAVFYDDEYWLLYDEDGHVIRTKSKEDCLQLAGAQLQEEFTNYCIECLPEYVSDNVKSYSIPIQPVLLDKPIMLGGQPQGGKPGQDEKGNRPPAGSPEGGEHRPERPPSGPPNGGPVTRGIALNGVAFDAPAPVQLILSGYTIPPLDEAGGHINMDAGYHYHAATGFSYEIKQADHHAPLIGYAMDGIGIYAHMNEDGSVPENLDPCRGHYDETRKYHYHVDAAGTNNFIDCFSGATVTE